ncbi:hypothetical protein BBJ28_00014241 [Nothophytophthora sp. Chile5]|nr:hypothetical protein BBJ28_00014241 [Nothophytophthora sp. Chile5]
MINSAVNDLITCYEGLSGQAPSCSGLNTLKACVNTALNAVSGAKAASSAVTAANLKRLDSGLDKLDKALSLTTDMCKMGCEGGVCGTSDGTGAETLTYSVPTGRACREMHLAVHGDTGITPMDCAQNLYSGGLKVEFTYVGCYVGATDDPASYSGCAPAYESRVFDNAMFVRCLDQFGRQLNLKDGTTGTGTASTGTGTGSSAPTIQRTVSGWLLPLLVATLWLQ